MLIKGEDWLVSEQIKHFTVYIVVLSAVQDCKTHKNAAKAIPTHSQMEAQKAATGAKGSSIN